LLKTVTKGDKALIRGFNGWYWLIPGLQKGQKPADLVVFALHFQG